MDQSIFILALSAISLGFIHTIIGPDHYLPFVAMAKTRTWSTSRTISVVAICGLGHALSSVAIGAIFIFAGFALDKVFFINELRGNIASWFLFSVGLVYTIWAIIHRLKHPNHEHTHLNNDNKNKKSMTFWVLFAIFVFGPCEPLIPLLMYPAANHNLIALVFISLLFTVTTISTMLAMTLLMLKGASFVKFHALEKYQHVLAGSTLTLCGASIIFLGL